MKKTIAIALLSCAAFLAAAQPKVLSHRGFYTSEGKTVTDENSLESLKRAQENGIWAVEFDVHLTSDDSLVILHGPKIQGTNIEVQKSTFETVRAARLPFGNQVPTLREWLALAKATPSLLLFLEMKAHATPERETQLAEAVVKEVHAMGMQDQVRYLSFSRHELDEVKRLDPGAIVTLNASGNPKGLQPDMVKDKGYAGLSYHYQLFLEHPEWVSRAGELGMETFFWMVDNTFMADVAVEIGASVITSNYPDVIMRHYARNAKGFHGRRHRR